eukprot:SAG31_NODE_2249_length_6085_cov_2.993819_6_plen_169_part_00
METSAFPLPFDALQMWQMQAAAEAEQKRKEAEEQQAAEEAAAQAEAAQAAEQAAAEQAAAEQAAAEQAAAEQAAAEQAAAEQAAAEQAAAEQTAVGTDGATLEDGPDEYRNHILPPISKLRAAAGAVKVSGGAARNWRHTAEHLPVNPLQWSPEQVTWASQVWLCDSS